jgi:hypothetical protein
MIGELQKELFDEITHRTRETVHFPRDFTGLVRPVVEADARRARIAGRDGPDSQTCPSNALRRSSLLHLGDRP